MKRAPFYLLVLVVCAVAFLPFYWMINTSLIRDSDLFSYPPKFFPKQGLIGTCAHYPKGNPILTWLRPGR